MSIDTLLFTFYDQAPHPKCAIINNQQSNRNVKYGLQGRRKETDRTFRFKKAKRYDQCLENTQLEKSILALRREDQKNNQTIENNLNSPLQMISLRSIQMSSKPIVYSQSRKFPKDFKEKPQSLQLIKQKQIGEQQGEGWRIQNINKRHHTSKDRPKIHFPVSENKLPMVFRSRSITTKNINRTINNNKTVDGKNVYNNIQQSSDRMIRVNQEMIHNSYPSKKRELKHRSIKSFQLNGQQTPRFDRK